MDTPAAWAPMTAKVIEFADVAGAGGWPLDATWPSVATFDATVNVIDWFMLRAALSVMLNWTGAPPSTVVSVVAFTEIGGCMGVAVAWFELALVPPALTAWTT